MTLAALVPRIGKYDLLEEVGHGGMATVYRAHDPRLARDVAVKVIHRHLRESAEVGRRFTAEARAVAKLRHPNIVEIYDVADDDAPERFLVAELITGGSLRKILTKLGTLPAEIAACVGVELADGLAHAHERGVVHRDVKPENVLFEIPSDDELARPEAQVLVKLTDFGIAKMLDQQGVTATGQVLGSPAYMAPEQIECGDIDARSDVFGLGVLLYESMVGHLPFEGKNPAQVLRRVLDGIYPPADQELPTVGARWSQIAARALANKVEDRYPSMEMVRDELLFELRALGIDDPRLELRAFFRDPEGYRAALPGRLVPRLVERGRSARDADDVVGAAGHFNRALAFAPHDVALLSLVSGMTRRRERRTLAMRLGVVAIVVASGAGLAFAALRLPRREPRIVPTATATAPVISAAPVRDEVPPVTPTPSVLPTATATRIVGPATVSPTASPPPNTPDEKAAGEREVRFVPNVPRALVSIDGAPAEELSGVVRTLKVGTHTYTVEISEATKDCCKPTTAIGFRVQAGATAQDQPIWVPLRPALLAVDGPSTELMYCSGLFAGGRAANGIIEVPLKQLSLPGDCFLQSDTGKKTHVELHPGVTTRLRW